VSSLAESLVTPLRRVARRFGLADLFAWWASELGAMLPPSWRERFASRSTAYVAVEGDVWRELRPSGGRLAEAGRADLAALDVAGRRTAFRRLLADGPGAAGNVWLVLSGGDVLVRPVTLPLAAEEALRDAVGFELDRFTPFAAGHAFYDFRVTGRDTAAQRLVLDLAVASRALVDRRLAELQELGATVLGVSTADDLAGAAAPLNLLATEQRAGPPFRAPPSPRACSPRSRPPWRSRPRSIRSGRSARR
jgi:general secretion pathway protein L